MTRSTMPIRTVTRRESVASTAAIARAALNQNKADRARRTAALVRQSMSRDAE